MSKSYEHLNMNQQQICIIAMAISLLETKMEGLYCVADQFSDNNKKDEEKIIRDKADKLKLTIELLDDIKPY